MLNHASVGDVVKFTNNSIKRGLQSQIDYTAKLLSNNTIFINKLYVVESLEVYDWYSELQLHNVDGIFNSVMLIVMPEHGLGLYTNETDTVVAKSPADAIAVWSANIGDDYIKDGYGDIEDWTLVDPNKLFIVHYDDEPIELPENAGISKGNTGWSVTTEAKNWATERGFLCSTEF